MVVDIRPASGSSPHDLPKGITPHLQVTVMGTRYRLDVSPTMTDIEVLEGKVHVTGSALRRLYEEADVKSSFVKDLDLAAGDKALGILPFAAPGSLNPATQTTAAIPLSPLLLPDPWNHPRVQQLMDQWVHSAIPPCSTPGVIMRYNDWAQPLSRAARAVAPPDHPADWTRYRYLWENRTRYDSTNLCTLGEFLERSIDGQGMEDCVKARDRVQPPPPIDERPAQISPVSPPAPLISVPAPSPAAAPLPGVLSLIETIPQASWINGRPDLRTASQVVVMAFTGYDPYVLACGKEAQKRNVQFMAIVSGPDVEQKKWNGRTSFPIALGDRARDVLLKMASASAKYDPNNPVPGGIGFLIDKDGRIIATGTCSRLLGSGKADSPKK